MTTATASVQELQRQISVLRAKAKLILAEVIEERDSLRDEVAALQVLVGNKDIEIRRLRASAARAENSRDSADSTSAAEDEAHVLKETLKKHKEVIEQQRRELDHLRENAAPPDSIYHTTPTKGKNSKLLNSKYTSKTNLKAKLTRIKKWGPNNKSKKEHGYATRTVPTSQREREKNHQVQPAVGSWKRSVGTPDTQNPPPRTASKASDYGSGGQQTPIDQIPEFNDELVIKTQAGELKGAALERLILRLTRKDQNEQQFQDIFILTYRSYCSPSELVDSLIALWDNLSVEKYGEDDSKLMRVRLSQFLKLWMERHWYDFAENGVETIKNFINTTLSLTLPLAGSTLQQTIANKMSEAVKVREVFMNPPTSRVPQGPINDITDIDTLELARQLALMDQSIYREIKPRECMNQAWSKAERQPQAPNLMTMINRFNVMSSMVCTAIVSESNLRRRRLLLTKFIKLAQKLRELHDFHSLMAILAALSNAAVSRLKKTWEGIASNHQTLLDNMQALMSAEGSYHSFRAILKMEDPPSVPWIGVYLADLTFIEDGNPNYLDPVNETKIVNYQRMKMMAAVINEIRFYQQDRYGLNPVDSIQDFIEKMCKNRKDEKQCYAISLQVEPRQQA